MIDWFPVFSNALWIVGLAILFAHLSFQSYLKVSDKQREIGNWPNIVGLTLICLGLMVTTDNNWEKVLWGVIILITLFQQKITQVTHRLVKK